MFKPAPGHRRGFAPASCLCAECSELVLLMRCPKRDSRGRQCGSFRGHRHRPHLLLVDTVFLIALERVDQARWGDMPTWARRRRVDAAV